MSLVAYYSGSEDEEDVVQVHDEDIAGNVENPTVNGNNITTSASTIASTTQNTSTLPLSKPSVMMSMFMVDDDDNEETESNLDPSSSDNSTNDVNPVWDERLPKPKEVVSANEANADVEIGPIPPKKVYGDEELPPPKSTTYSSLAMGKKVQGKVCISIPFLNSLEEDQGTEDGERKKLLKPSQKGSGLFSLLPQPKNYLGSTVFSSKAVPHSSNSTLNLATNPSNSSVGVPMPGPSVNKLIPDSVKNKLKRSANEKTNELRAKYSKNDIKSAVKAKSKHTESDSDDDDGGDFFSFNSVTTVDPIALEKLKLPTPNFEKVQPPEEMETDQSQQHMEEQVHYAQPSQADDLMKFIQSRKGKKEDVRLVDINADDLRPDNTEWIKNITDESAQPARRAKGLGGMVKRKHQITYLAFEAKAREQELKNQWAQNRANKMATKNKYGF